MNKNKDYLITEKPSRALFAFALPMIIGNLFQQAYTIVDSAIVGHYVGETALAAVGASYALTSIFNLCRHRRRHRRVGHHQPITSADMPTAA